MNLLKKFICFALAFLTIAGLAAGCSESGRCTAVILVVHHDVEALLVKLDEQYHGGSCATIPVDDSERYRVGQHISFNSGPRIMESSPLIMPDAYNVKIQWWCPRTHEERP